MHVFVPCPAPSRDADAKPGTGCPPSAGAQQASKKRGTQRSSHRPHSAAILLRLECQFDPIRNGRKLIGGK